jgi:hypothetical protein
LRIFLIAFVVFFHGIGIFALSILDLLVLLVHKWFTGQFCKRVRYFLTDNRFAQFYRFSCAIFPWF